MSSPNLHPGGVQLFGIRDGRAVRVVFPRDRERGLADLGPTPEGQRDPR